MPAEDDDTETTAAPAETSGEGDDGDAAADPATGDADAPASTVGPTTTIAPLADLPPCPVDALDAADGPVEITFWHGMANELETALIDLVDGYNASQDRVEVVLQNQTAYESTIDKYIAGRRRQPSRHRPAARVHRPVVRPVGHVRPRAGVHRCRRVRHGADPAAHRQHLRVRRRSSGRCRSTSRARSSTTTS